MAEDRKFKESPFGQGENERVAYPLTVPARWATPPFTGISVQLKLLHNLQDVSAAHLSGSPTAVGNVITTPFIHSLQAGKKYRLEILFTDASGSTKEAYGIIEGER